VVLELANGTNQASEIYGGSSYFSQSTAGVFFGWRNENSPRAIIVRWPWGAETRHEVPAGAQILELVAPDA
jgi:hypothetical protein